MTKKPTPVMVRVITRRMTDGNATDQRVIDHANPDDRKWLGGHSFWAMRNDHSVSTVPEIKLEG